MICLINVWYAQSNLAIHLAYLFVETICSNYILSNIHSILSNYMPIHRSICVSTAFISIYLSVHPSIRLSVRPSVRPSVHPAIRPFIRLFSHSSVYPSIFRYLSIKQNKNICFALSLSSLYTICLAIRLRIVPIVSGLINSKQSICLSIHLSICMQK